MRSDENWKAFKKQRNKCVKLLRKAKNDYYGNLNLKLLTDNRKCWRTVKPLFSDKIQTSTAITLLENNELVNDNSVVANIFNDYFVSITNSQTISTIKKGDWGERFVLVNGCHGASTNDRYPSTKTFGFKFTVKITDL